MGNWLCNPPNRPNQIIITLRGEPERILHNIQSPIKPVCTRKTYQKEIQTDCNKMDKFFNVSPDIQTDIHKIQTDGFLNVTLPTKHPLSVNED